MKLLTKRLPYLLIVLALLAGCSSPEEPAANAEVDYEFVENDPLNVRIYTLDNGMKVYMSINKDEPRLQTMIAVRTGSKQDPADATGLAHYLEHMLFKGSSQIATSNWGEEQKLLQQISDLYEQHRGTTDEEERKTIYAQIDSISTEAARLAIPNEYDKMIASLGARGTNAFTSLERTVYINDIPSNELEKWLMVESERFSELVLRLFHTELEVVYEEFNRSQDSDFRASYRTLMENLFKKHSYGTQTTIGTGEHLKNPSMEKIHEYFNTYYVPNNMAIVLAGDIDPEASLEMIKKYFGHYEPKEVPTYQFEPEDPITEPVVKDVFGSNAEFIQMGFRLDGVGSKDAQYVQLIDGILNNGQAGLIDLNLVNQQKVLRASSRASIETDYSTLILRANPRQGQSLDEVRELLLSQIEIIKNGDYEDWLIDAVIKDLKLSETRQAEYNWIRAFKMMDAFILEQDWKDVVNEYEAMTTITKEELSAFAKEKLTNSYVAVNKKIGEKDIHKVDKPTITPLDIERDSQSEFFKKFEEKPSSRLEPVFLDYGQMISDSELDSKIPFSYIENTTNEVFQLYYILDMGSDNDKELAIAVEYLPYLGTSKYSAEELQKEFFKIGVSFDVFTSEDRVYVSLSGLEEGLEQGVELFEEVLRDVTPNEEAYGNLVQDILKRRENDKLSKGRILNLAMYNYAKYGADSPYQNIIPSEDLQNMDPKSLVQKIQSICDYKHRIFYYGRKPQEEVAQLLNKAHEVQETLLDYPEAKTYTELETTENKVYFVDYDMVQTEMLLVSKSQNFSLDVLAQASIFNEYFGSGLSSIVFQEIRESKALAYSAYCIYSSPEEKDEAHFIRAYIGAQVDKLDQAADAMLDLMNNMPEAEIQFEESKLAALKKIETERITKTSIFWDYETAKRRGIDYDVRKNNYETISNMQMADLKSFFDQNIKGSKYTFLVIGKKPEMDFEALGKLGPVKELTLEEVFGY